MVRKKDLDKFKKPTGKVRLLYLSGLMAARRKSGSKGKIALRNALIEARIHQIQKVSA